MKKIKVMSVYGTRPEAIKMCPLIREFENHESIESIVCLTAQHREMLDSVNEFFSVKADFDLNIMKRQQTISSITTDIITGMNEVFNQIQPDIVLVHGDTTTSFAAALSAFYHQITVGHVEAGLRTYDKYSPFPEEMNRCLTGKIADFHFAPTELNRRNLESEGITKNVFITGNTVLDTFKYTIHDDYKFKAPELASIDFSDSYRYITLTAHRRENQGGGIENICRAVIRLTEMFSDIKFIYPVHLSPAVRNTVMPLLSGHDRIILCDPVDLTDMHNLMAKSYMIMTDSGGIQEEAPFLGKPVLVLRSETERPEAAEAGTVEVIGTDEQTIVDKAARLLTDKSVYDKMAHAVNPYGDGHASERISDIIERSF